MAVRAFQARHGHAAFEARFAGFFARVEASGRSVGLLTPMTWMNRSGESVAQAFDAHPELSPDRLLVVHDDLDLPLCRLRLRGGGGPGGQRGLANILDTLGTRDVPRLRIGIGRPADGVEPRDWVLSDFSGAEQKPLRDTIDRAAEAIEAWIADGLERAMEVFNRPPARATPPKPG